MPEVERSLPPFEQIANHYAAQIASGKLQPGDPIPSNVQLQNEWKVSRATANRAVAKLKADGLVIAKVGVGVTVAKPRTTLF